jgi:RNA-binding signal recognition particle 68
MMLCYNLSQEEESLGVTDGASTEDDSQKEKLAARRLERQDLFVTRADIVLRPLFRYCQYELKQAGEVTMEEPRLSQTTGGDSGKDVTNDDAVVFRDQELVLDNKELRVLLLKLQSLDQEEKEFDDSHEGKKGSNAEGETQFLTSLSILDDALDVVVSLENGLAKLNSGPAVQAKVRQYALWKGYLQFTKTQKVMNHTEKLLLPQKNSGNDSMGPAEKVHVYDSLLQHAKSLLALPRPGDEKSASEEDEFTLQVQANILRLRALKTFQMGWYYYTHLHKYAAAYSLMEHSALLCKRAQEEIAACDEDMPRADEYLAELEELPLESVIAAIRAALALQQRQRTRKLRSAGVTDASAMVQEPISTDRPLLLRLYDVDGGSPNAPIAELRPIPLPCKPVFYDLAYDYIMDPSNSHDAVETFVREHTVDPSGEDEEGGAGASNTRSGGIFGWLTGSQGS